MIVWPCNDSGHVARMPAGGVQSGGASNDSGASVQRADAEPQIIQNLARVNENH